MGFLHNLSIQLIAFKLWASVYGTRVPQLRLAPVHAYAPSTPSQAAGQAYCSVDGTDTHKGVAVATIGVSVPKIANPECEYRSQLQQRVSSARYRTARHTPHVSDRVPDISR